MTSQIPMVKKDALSKWMWQNENPLDLETTEVRDVFTVSYFSRLVEVESRIKWVEE